ncbi:unnamed protein product [Schistosoma rodhaini]|uniref:Mitochondrial DNA polymerase catalytic subunit n=4 Tax=Schistosoma rodhaini TaxID=6188 RepID=A0AA85EVS1_9TREM|nr:unnamed protein product [Schistosoma rodhaini]
MYSRFVICWRNQGIFLQHRLCFYSSNHPKQSPTYNEVNILMIDRNLQKVLFNCQKYDYQKASFEVLQEFCRLGIDITSNRHYKDPLYFSIPDLSGSNVKEHLDSVAKELSHPYMKLLESFGSPPDLPKIWESSSGWTKYNGDKTYSVEAPLEDALIFDTEVLVKEGHVPTMAVALTSDGWYSWTSKRLSVYDDNYSNDINAFNSLIPIYGSKNKDISKCVIGHFVSYDRARILEEYLLDGTGLRFVDTLSLHVAVSGLTSTQRFLKTSADKHLFNNKTWQEFIGRKNDKQPLGGKPSSEALVMDLDWLSETSLNSLPDIYRLYCKKEPPQDKQLRSIFESGTIEDVRTNFQELFNYCAVDVLMTYEIIQVLWPIFKERFPHPATFCGLLEMSSMYLPINDNWIKFQEKAESSYTENILRQKKLLMQLADQALAKYSNSQEYKNDPWLWDLDWSKPKVKCKTEVDEKVSRLPKWYRDLIPKPVKDNLDSGPALLTAQMRIAPKLLKLCWQGLPLHYDRVLKWGVLIPGRIPQPYGDPQYYIESFKNTENTECIDSNDAEKFSTNSNVLCHYDSSIRPIIPVVKSTAAGDETLDFPYGAYLNYWLADVKRRLLADFQLNESTSSCDNFSDSLAVAYSHRIKPDIRDANLLDELKRSIEIMPLEKEERQRLASTISTIRKLGEQKRFQMDSKLQKIKNNNHNELIYEKVGELQAQGSAFWLNSNRFDQNSSNYSKYRRRNAVRYAVDTVNPVIPTCWFKHLPHESGTGLPVGSPLSRSFQSHIASHRLHSANFNPNDTISANIDTIKLKPVMGLADRLLHDRVHATFWQSYSKRIKSQMAIWLPHDQLPKNVLNDQSYNCKANYGAILPQVITCGTVSRRAVEPLWLTASNADENRLGSEIKAMVQSPPGYVFVGADVDSQEMWIAALIGDAGVGFQGSTPYGWMTLQGNKLDGTDLHTKIAKEMGIKRSESKVLNYSRLYGSGIEFASHLLAKFCNITPEQASLKAKQLFQITKGRRTIVDSFASNDGTSMSTSKWQGGSESAVFNQLESIARSPEPRTPFLNAQLTRALNPKLVKDDFLPSRVNWVVQSSAVDYLHCMLVLMRWLINKFKIPARLCISIHDELRYICPKSYMYQVALALQISNLLTRTFFVYQLGMRDLPESVAFFSSVEVDTCIRKEAKDDCVTPSNSSGLQNGYGVSPGQSLTMQDILDRTGGSMKL